MSSVTIIFKCSLDGFYRRSSKSVHYVVTLKIKIKMNMNNMSRL